MTKRTHHKCLSVSQSGHFFASVIFIPRLNLTVVLSNHYALSLSCSEALPASLDLEFYVGLGFFSHISHTNNSGYTLEVILSNILLQNSQVEKGQFLGLN